MRKIHLRLIALCLLICFISIFIFLIHGIPMVDFLSLVRAGDIISYNKTCTLIGGIPLVLLFIILSIVALFNKEAHAKTPDSMNNALIIITIIPFVIGFIADCLLPFLLMALSYTSCPQKKLHDFDVTDIELCKTIVDNRGYW